MTKLKVLTVLCCLMAFLIIGCGQNRMKSVSNIVMDTTTEEIAKTPTSIVSEPELPTIDFLEEVQTIPEGIEIFDQDSIIHYRTEEEFRGSTVKLNDAGEPDISGQEHTFDPFIFDDALSAISDKDVLIFFEWWVLNISENYCKSPRNRRTYDQTGAFYAYFTTRKERDKFAEQFVDTNPWRLLKHVIIISSEQVYFSIVLVPEGRKMEVFCE